MIGIVSNQWFNNPWSVMPASVIQENIKQIKPDEEVVIIDCLGSYEKCNIFLEFLRRYKRLLVFYIRKKNEKSRQKI